MLNKWFNLFKQCICKTTRYDVLFNHSVLGICVVDKNYNIIDINDNMCRMLQYQPEDLIDTNLKLYTTCPHLWDEIKPTLFSNVVYNNNTTQQIEFQTCDGTDIPTIVGISRINYNQFIITVVDITKQKEDEETIYHLAYYDTLTGLPNRLHFNERVENIIQHAQDTSTQFAVFLVDLDNFKRINDTMGHHTGDQVLKEIAIRLNDVVTHHCSISSEIGDCFAARLGGDEFVLIVENIVDIDKAQMIAETIYDQFDQPISIEQHKYFAKLSLGIGIYPHDGDTISLLLKSADLALYTAKHRGKNQYFFHEASMSSRLEQLIYYEQAINYFIKSQDFQLAIQPIMCCDTHQIIGGEILFRGNQQKYQNIKLQKLISIAESNNDIVALGKQILYNGCKIGYSCVQIDPSIVLSINVSIRELEDFSFINDIKRTLELTNFPPQNLAIEVTESLFMSNFKNNVNKLNQLKQMGIHISIDDFGKGYSSMSYLRYLPDDKLKIDREFIRDLDNDAKSQEIIKGITLMGKALNMTVCVEGVETRQQYDIIRQLDVDQIQGYFMGPPVASDNFFQLLERQKNDN